MQIPVTPELQMLLAVVAAAWCAVVAWKAFDYMRMERRRRREKDGPPGSRDLDA